MRFVHLRPFANWLSRALVQAAALIFSAFAFADKTNKYNFSFHAWVGMLSTLLFVTTVLTLYWGMYAFSPYNYTWDEAAAKALSPSSAEKSKKGSNSNASSRRGSEADNVSLSVDSAHTNATLNLLMRAQKSDSLPLARVLLFLCDGLTCAFFLATMYATLTALVNAAVIDDWSDASKHAYPFSTTAFNRIDHLRYTMLESVHWISSLSLPFFLLTCLVGTATKVV